MNDTAHAPLSVFERRGVILFLLLLVLFGIQVEIRSAFIDRRMGDWGVYVRAAWAIYHGNKLYDEKDDNGWHYNYPPFFAIALLPFADPPKEFLPAPLMPFEVSVGLWYYVSLGWGLLGVITLARAIEERGGLGDQPRYCRRWWALRLWPVLICLLPIGHTLMRGQVNLMILGMLCLMIAAFLRKQSFRAGIWLSLACAIKVIPAFLIVYPLFRRDWRCLGGLALGLAVTLVALPLMVWGPSGTVDAYQEFSKTLLGPAFFQSQDKSRFEELLGPGLTDNQSLKFVFYNITHLDKSTRDLAHLPAWPKWTWVILGSLMTLTTLIAGSRAKFRNDTSLVLLLGSLLFLMSVLSPVCHLHYFTYSLPLIMGLMASGWQRHSTLQIPRGMIVLFAAFMIANVLPNLPFLEVIRDVGLPLFAGVGLWLVAIVQLWRGESMVRRGFQREETPLARAG